MRHLIGRENRQAPVGRKNDNATKEDIEAKLKTLTEKSHKLAEAMYKKEGGEAGAQPNQKAKKDDDDVIDAEVE